MFSYVCVRARIVNIIFDLLLVAQIEEGSSVFYAGGGGVYEASFYGGSENLRYGSSIVVLENRYSCSRPAQNSGPDWNIVMEFAAKAFNFIEAGSVIVLVVVNRSHLGLGQT